MVLPRRSDLVLGIGGDGVTVGLRCPANELVRDLCRRVGPLAVTSANAHGHAPATTAAQVLAAFGSEIDVVVDGGLCEGIPSSVVVIEECDVRCSRAGAIAFDDVLDALRGAG